jgi:hypothetical protein
VISGIDFRQEDRDNVDYGKGDLTIVDHPCRRAVGVTARLVLYHFPHNTITPTTNRSRSNSCVAWVLFVPGAGTGSWTG